MVLLIVPHVWIVCVSPFDTFHCYNDYKYNHHHLHQPALDIASESGVWLDTTTNHDVIRLIRKLVKENGKAFCRLADHDRFHAGANRAATKRFGNTVRLDDFLLPLGIASAVTPHRRNDEWPSSMRLKKLSNSFDNLGNVCDAAAASRDGNSIPCPDLIEHVGLS